MIALLLTLFARLLLIAIVAWCAYVAACIGAQAWRDATLLTIPEDDEDDETGEDPGAEWDRARDREADADLWPVIA